MTDKEWEEKCNLYIKIHDAVVRDNEKLYEENVRLKNAVAAEREACAQVCEDAINNIWEFYPELVNQVGKNVCTNLAEAIRARGQG